MADESVTRRVVVIETSTYVIEVSGEDFESILHDGDPDGDLTDLALQGNPSHARVDVVDVEEVMNE